MDYRRCIPLLLSLLVGANAGHCERFLGERLSSFDRLDETAIDADERKQLAIPGLVAYFQSNQRAIAHVAISPDGTLLATSGWDNIVHLYKLGDKTPKSWAKLDASPSGIAFSPDGKLLITGSSDTRLLGRDLTGEKPVESIAVQGHRNRPFAVAFSPTGKMFASGSAGPVLRVWKPKAIEPEAFGVIANEDAPTIAISSLAFSHDGKYVIAASHLGKDSLQMWDTSGDFLDDKALPDATARIVACAPKEPVLAFAGDDAIVHLWNFGAPKVTKLHQLPGHPGKAATPLVKALAFSPDGKTMASAGQDKSVRIWNTATGEKTLEWLLPHEPRAVAFSSEGRHLAIGNSDGAIFVVRLAAAKSRSN